MEDKEQGKDRDDEKLPLTPSPNLPLSLCLRASVVDSCPSYLRSGSGQALTYDARLRWR
jgi:hypothetical protein